MEICTGNLFSGTNRSQLIRRGGLNFTASIVMGSLSATWKELLYKQAFITQLHDELKFSCHYYFMGFLLFTSSAKA